MHSVCTASLLKELKHNNIVVLHDIVQTKSTLTFVFEYVPKDLSRYLAKSRNGLAGTNCKLFLFQLLRGLSFCHERRILHRLSYWLHGIYASSTTHIIFTFAACRMLTLGACFVLQRPEATELAHNSSRCFENC